ncbi:MAG TPA: acyl transferase [Bacteroidia bacterium]|nr:acyl transferase [Bacteroidia bacterium]
MDRKDAINYHNLTAEVFSLKNGEDQRFEQVALQLFKLQFQYNAVYRQFVKALRVEAETVRSIRQIPFLPIEFFKTQKILTETGIKKSGVVFTSSGTSQTGTSIHFVNDTDLYEESFLKSFEMFYGNPSAYCFLALLPSYLERKGSSLVYMAQKLIELSHNKASDFYLHNVDELVQTISELKEKKQKVFLLGVSYALLDLAETGITLNDDFIVMETGGMKGRREELIKSELHRLLKQKLGVKKIHAEYGMTELLSQAYARQNGLFESPPWMRILVRDTNDPFQYLANQKTGGINVIDLANINSCCFIATQDLGKLHEDRKFELMGRFDNSDIRGCNLLID